MWGGEVCVHVRVCVYVGVGVCVQEAFALISALPTHSLRQKVQCSRQWHSHKYGLRETKAKFNFFSEQKTFTPLAVTMEREREREREREAKGLWVSHLCCPPPTSLLLSHARVFLIWNKAKVADWWRWCGEHLHSLLLQYLPLLKLQFQVLLSLCF